MRDGRLTWKQEYGGRQEYKQSRVDISGQTNKEMLRKKYKEMNCIASRGRSDDMKILAADCCGREKGQKAPIKSSTFVSRKFSDAFEHSTLFIKQ